MQNKKTWKQISHIRKNSTDSLNESFESNSKSTNSQKFTRFNFQNDIDGNPKPRKAHPSRDHLHDVSVMSKRSNKSTDKNVNFLNHDFLFKMGKQAPNMTYPKDKNGQIKFLVAQLKYLNTGFKKILQYFEQQIAEIKRQWQLSYQQLVKSQQDRKSNIWSDKIKNQIQDYQSQVKDIVKRQNLNFKHQFLNPLAFNLQLPEATKSANPSPRNDYKTMRKEKTTQELNSQRIAKRDQIVTMGNLISQMRTLLDT